MGAGHRLGVTLPALLVPDGRLRSPRWRVVMATAIAGPVLFVVGAILIPGTSTDLPVRFENRLGQPGLVGEVAKGAAVAGLALHGLSLLAALLCVILRFWSSRGVERQQLRWTTLWLCPVRRPRPAADAARTATPGRHGTA